MGCASSADEKFNFPIDEELEQEHNFIGLNKRGE
jgi:hypothetical protein